MAEINDFKNDSHIAAGAAERGEEEDEGAILLTPMSSQKTVTSPLAGYYSKRYLGIYIYIALIVILLCSAIWLGDKGSSNTEQKSLRTSPEDDVVPDDISSEEPIYDVDQPTAEPNDDELAADEIPTKDVEQPIAEPDLSSLQETHHESGNADPTSTKHDVPGLDDWIAKMRRDHPQRAIGHWYKDPQICQDKKREAYHSCTPSGFTWETGYRYIAKNEGCELLKILGVQSILFAGDSFIRHVFAATKLVLTGDYEEGGVVTYPPEYRCSGEGQFSAKPCREYALHSRKVCHDSPSMNPIRLDVTKDDQVPLLHPDDAKYDLIIWGIGNHNIRGLGTHSAASAIRNDPNPREGILNATIYSSKIFSKVCDAEGSSWMTRSQVFRNRVLWLPPHQRVQKHYYPDEHPMFIKQFFKESTTYLQQHCHLGNPIDTFSMTNYFLTSNITELAWDGVAMSYDGVHYGRTVNVNKVQEMFKTIIHNVKAGVK